MMLLRVNTLCCIALLIVRDTGGHSVPSVTSNTTPNVHLPWKPGAGDKMELCRAHSTQDNKPRYILKTTISHNFLNSPGLTWLEQWVLVYGEAISILSTPSPKNITTWRSIRPKELNGTEMFEFRYLGMEITKNETDGTFVTIIENEVQENVLSVYPPGYNGTLAIRTELVIDRKDYNVTEEFKLKDVLACIIGNAPGVAVADDEYEWLAVIAIIPVMILIIIIFWWKKKKKKEREISVNANEVELR